MSVSLQTYLILQMGIGDSVDWLWWSKREGQSGVLEAEVQTAGGGGWKGEVWSRTSPIAVLAPSDGEFQHSALFSATPISWNESSFSLGELLDLGSPRASCWGSTVNAAVLFRFLKSFSNIYYAAMYAARTLQFSYCGTIKRYSCLFYSTKRSTSNHE